MKKILALFVLSSIVLSSVTLTGCTKSKDKSTELTGVENTEKSKAITKNRSSASGDGEYFDDSYGTEYITNGQGKTYLSTYPLFYADDFPKLPASGCLFASVASYQSGKIITPDKFIKKLSSSDKENPDAMAKLTSKITGLKYEKGSFSLRKIESVTENGGSVIVHIKNKSPYGNQGAYFLIEEVITNGTCVGMLPDYTAAFQMTKTITNDDRTVYSLAPLVEACGNNGDVYYIMQKGSK